MSRNPTFTGTLPQVHHSSPMELDMATPLRITEGNYRIDTHRVTRMVPACLCNACESGRRACPSPEACELPETGFARLTDAVFAVALVALIAFVVVMEWQCLMPGGCG